MITIASSTALANQHRKLWAAIAERGHRVEVFG